MDREATALQREVREALFEAQRHVIEDLGDDYTTSKTHAMDALAELQIPQALPLLCRCLKDQDPILRTGAAYALAKWPTLEAFEALSEVMQDDDDEVRYNVYEALFSVLEKGGWERDVIEPKLAPRLLEALSWLVEQGSDDTDVDSLLKLCKFGPSPPLLAWLEEHLQAPREELRFLALSGLAWSAAAESLPAFVRAYQAEQDDEMRVSFVSRLGDFGSKEVLPTLEAAVEEGLQLNDGYDWEDLLCGAIDSVEALAAVEAVPLLHRILDEAKSLHSRMQALKLLAELERDSYLSWLERYAAKQGPVLLQVYAWENLVRLGKRSEEECAACLLEVLQKDEYEFALINALRWLVGHQIKEAIEPILALYQACPSQWVRGECASSLASLQAKEALGVLEASLREAPAHLKQTIEDAIRKLKAESYQPPIQSEAFLLARLRELLNQPPSQPAWKALLSTFRRCHKSVEVELALSYAEAHLDSWPAGQRFAELPFLDGAGVRREMALWKLCRGWSGEARLDTLQRYVHFGGDLSHIHAIELHEDSLFDDGEECLRLLAKMDSLQQVELFDVEQLHIHGDGVIVSLLRVMHGSLRRLFLSTELLGDETTKAIGQLLPAGQLTELSLGGWLTDEGMKDFVQSPAATALRSLQLGGSFGPGGIEAFVKRPMKQLEELRLYSSGLDQACVARIARAPWAAQLRELTLRFKELGYGRPDPTHGLGVEGVRALVESETLGNLKVLRLECCQLDEEAALLLAEAPWLEGLETLSVSFNDLSEACQEALQQHPRLRGVGKLTVA